MMVADSPRRRREQREVLDELNIREALFRYAIAAYVLMFGIGGVASIFVTGGPGPGAPRIVTIATCATCIPVSFMVARMHLGSVWWSNRTRIRYGPEVFVMYADLGLLLVLVTFSSGELALFGTALYAVTGAYASHFLRIRATVAHVVFSSVVICALAVAAVERGGMDVGNGVLRACVMLFVVNGTVVLIGAHSADIRFAIGRSFRISSTDPLTGLANRRAFERRAHRLIESSPGIVALLLIDIDHFKAINDTLGHGGGDAVLVAAAGVLREEVSYPMISARIGGDEFVVLVPEASDELVRRLADRLERALESAAGTGVSVGWATAPGGDQGEDPSAVLSTLLTMADGALYATKRSRNPGGE